MNGNYHHQISRFRYLHFFISRVIALEDEQKKELQIKRSGAITPSQGMERAMKPLPKRRVIRRTRSNSPLIQTQDKLEVKRPRLSDTR